MQVWNKCNDCGLEWASFEVEIGCPHCLSSDIEEEETKCADGACKL